MASTLQKTDLPDGIIACCDALLEKKASRILILDVKEASSITDYFIIASGESSPQLRAMANAARASLKSSHEQTGQVDGEPASGWVVMDAFEFIVHLFLPETRETYALERLWKDRPQLEIND
jgi:ribosome-associated protein